MPDDYNAGATPEQIAASPLVLDLDDDNDGVSDAQDAFPLDASDSGDAALDNDRDGATNLEEFQAGANPNVNEPAVTTIINTILLGAE